MATVVSKSRPHWGHCHQARYCKPGPTWSAVTSPLRVQRQVVAMSGKRSASEYPGVDECGLRVMITSRDQNHQNHARHARNPETLSHTCRCEPNGPVRPPRCAPVSDADRPRCSCAGCHPPDKPAGSPSRCGAPSRESVPRFGAQQASLLPASALSSIPAGFLLTGDRGSLQGVRSVLRQLQPADVAYAVRKAELECE